MSIYFSPQAPQSTTDDPRFSLISYWRPKADSQPGGKKGERRTEGHSHHAASHPTSSRAATLPRPHHHRHPRPPSGGVAPPPWYLRTPADPQPPSWAAWPPPVHRCRPPAPGLIAADPASSGPDRFGVASSSGVPIWGRVIWWGPPREAQLLPPYGGRSAAPGAAGGCPGAACLPCLRLLRTLGPARPVLVGHCCGCVIRCAGLVG
jgi:hypothetical protein